MNGGNMEHHKLRFYLSHLTIFSIMMLCLLGILLWQNRIYYKNLENENERNQKNYITVLSAYLSDCYSNNENNNNCEVGLSGFINKTFRSGVLTLTYNDNSYVFDKERYKDNRKPVTTIQTISNNPLVVISISKLTTQPIQTSLWNSITFSISDWKLDTSSFQGFINQLKSREFQNFIIYVAVPRSMFFWGSLLIFAISYIVVVRKFNRVIRRMLQTEDKLLEVESEKLFLHKQKNELFNKTQELESEMLLSKQKEVQYNEEMMTLAKQAEETEIKIQNLKGENLNLSKQVEISMLELEKLEALQNIKEKRIKELRSEITSQKNTNHEKTIELEELKNEVQKIQANKENISLKNNELNKELAKGSAQIQGLQNDYSVLMSELETHQEFIKIVEDENEQLSQKLNKIKEEKEEIEKNYKEAQIEIDKYKQLRNNSTFHVNNEKFKEGKFNEKIRLLLKNPDLEKLRNKKLKLNKGKHHSKDVVASVKDKLSSKLSDLGIIESITSTGYAPKQRAVMVLQNQMSKQYNEKRYIVNIYYDNDAGHGSEVLLTATNSWEAVLQAKLIREVEEFSHYQLKVILDDLT